MSEVLATSTRRPAPTTCIPHPKFIAGLFQRYESSPRSSGSDFIVAENTGTIQAVFYAEDRKTEKTRLFSVRLHIGHIVRHRDTLYMGGFDGIDVLRDEQIQSYFVDRTAGGRYQIVARGERTAR